MRKVNRSATPETKPKPNTVQKRSSSSQSSNSEKRSSGSRSSPRLKNPTSNPPPINKEKLFISNLDVRQKFQILEQKIKDLIGKKYELQYIQVRKSARGDYCYAFVDVKEVDKIDAIIAQFNNFQLNGTKILVERKKDKSPFKRNTGCYNCGKEGHFARECRGKKRNSSLDKNRKSSKHRKRESSSDSRQRERNKSKKHRYRTRDQKHEKKKKYQSSDSSSDSSSSSNESLSSSSSSESEDRKRRAKKRGRKQKNKKKHAKRKEKSKAKKESSESS